MDSDQFQNKTEHNAGGKMLWLYCIFVNSIKIQ